MLTSIPTLPCLDANKVTFFFFWGDFVFLKEAKYYYYCSVPAVTLLFLRRGDFCSDEMI